jgi:hypothetical protein
MNFHCTRRRTQLVTGSRRRSIVRAHSSSANVDVALELAVLVAMAMACAKAVSVLEISAFVVGGVSTSVFDAYADGIAFVVVVVLVAVVVAVDEAVDDAVDDAVDSGPIVDDASAVAFADFSIDHIAVAVAAADAPYGG